MKGLRDRTLASLLDWPFLAAATLLLLAAFLLRPAVARVARTYTKQPAAIRRPLRQLDFASLPSFEARWKVRLYDAPTQDIGTEEYVRAAIWGPQENAAGPMEFFVTYYSDPADKVPHTPDVCGRQAGWTVKRMSAMDLAVAWPPARSSDCTANQVTMTNSQGDMLTVFLFVAEGRFCKTRNQVRWQLAMPGNRKTYFSKVEVAAPIGPDGDETAAVEACRRLLRQVLPILLEEHFPASENLRNR